MSWLLVRSKLSFTSHCLRFPHKREGNHSLVSSIHRKAEGQSQKQLGILAGMDEFAASARMNQYEKGVHAPDFKTVRDLLIF